MTAFLKKCAVLSQSFRRVRGSTGISDGGVAGCYFSFFNHCNRREIMPCNLSDFREYIYLLLFRAQLLSKLCITNTLKLIWPFTKTIPLTAFLESRLEVLGTFKARRISICGKTNYCFTMFLHPFKASLYHS